MPMKSLLLLALACRGGDPSTGDTPQPTDDSAAGGLLAFDGEAPRNLLVVVVDTLRRDALGRYGGDSPSFDALAEQGVVLDGHVAPSNWTRPTVAAVLSGASTLEHGWHPEGGMASPDYLELASELLSEQGWATGQVSANPNHNLSDGFDIGRYPGFAASAEKMVEESVGAAKDLMAAGDGPWFLQLHFVEPHGPYDPPEAYLAGLDELGEVPWDLSTSTGVSQLEEAWPELGDEEAALARAHLELRYAAEVRYFDDHLGLLVDELDAIGALDDTLLVFVSDHGEAFFEHGSVGHGHSLHGTEIDGAALFWAKGLQPTARSEPSCHQDLLPTAFAALGLEPFPNGQGLVLGQEERDACVSLASFDEAPTQVALSTATHRLIYGFDGQRELYDRAADPEELDDIADDEPELLETLWGELIGHVERAQGIFSAEEALAPRGLTAPTPAGLVVDEPGEWIQVAAGAMHVCALDIDGYVRCWGDDRHGQVSGAPEGAGHTTVRAGDTHTCAVDAERELVCWGEDVQGCVSAAPAGDVAQVAAGVGVTCALNAAGAVTCWGQPLEGIPDETFWSVKARLEQACGGTADGEVLCWGTFTCSSGAACPPEPEPGLHGLTLGDYHGCGLTMEGAVSCWNRDEHALVDALTQVSFAPKEQGFVELAAGGYHTCALHADGSLSCWGADAYGQMKAPEGVYWQISAGRDLTCGITMGNHLSCWGKHFPSAGADDEG